MHAYLFFKTSKSLLEELLAFGVVALLLSYFLVSLAFAHSPEKHKHDLKSIPEKPEGMIEFQGSQAPGSEYIQEDGDPVNRDLSRDQDSINTGAFSSRGAHEMLSMTESESMVSPDKALLTRGNAIYQHMCVFCHGSDGNGGGPAMGFLYPWPRDFRTGIFKFRSTPTGTLPRDRDIYRTIVNGIPGTSMPNWSAALSPEDTWALVNVLKSFSPRFLNEKPGEPIKINEIGPASSDSIARGKDVYTSNKCDNCHGASGKGEGRLAESLMDAWKHAVFVHDITNPAYFKSGSTAKDIYRTLSTGLDGTPMESYVHLPEQDRWDLTHFIRSRFVKELKGGEFETDIFSKKTTKKLDTDPSNPVWDNLKATELVLRPLSARRGAVETIRFSSVHDGKQLAIRVQWDDPNRDENQDLGDQYLDQVAVQFALGAVTLHTHGHNEPFWGMGNRGKPVNIWHWKAGQKKEYAATTKGYMPDQDLDMDALIFGGVSPTVALVQPTTGRPVTELNAEGFSTLTPQPIDKQGVTGKGHWEDGVWTVVFIRDFEKSGKWDADLKQKDPLLTAFAVWDGLKEDRNGRKVVSVWQRLNIEGFTSKKGGALTAGAHEHHH